MAKVDTLPAVLVPLMSAPSIRLEWCAVCGRPHPLEQHHIVRRGAGSLYRAGIEVEKPTITLCGFGNNLTDADGRPYCHGLAHANMLHFRWVPGRVSAGAYDWGVEIAGGHLEYLLTGEPVDYLSALSMPGWKRLRRWRRCFA